MFRDNPLLQQMKAQMRESLPTIEGVVKGTERGFGFIETDKGESYFVPPPYMKKVMHGDRVKAVVRAENDKENAEPEELIEAGFDRFVARVKRFKGRLNLVPDHPLANETLRARTIKTIEDASLGDGDYVVAKLKRHPLNPDDNHFLAEVVELVAKSNDPHVPWWVTLAKQNLAKSEPTEPESWSLTDDGEREDLRALPFVTIDSESTKDMDDALFIEAHPDDGWWLTVAIADPTAYVRRDDEVDVEAKKRAFTQYLPGFNVPMLPRQLADELCSLVEGDERPTVCSKIRVGSDGEQIGEAKFFLATIRSHAKLAYENVSDWLEQTGTGWSPDSDEIAMQIKGIYQLANARGQWRQQHALVFPDRPDYRFEVDDVGNVVAIHADKRRVANRMVEEAMILANAACADLLSNNIGSGIFNAHDGLDAERIDTAISLLAEHDLAFDGEQLKSLEGYCKLRRVLDEQPTGYLDAKIRRMQAYAEIVSSPRPHFGMGLSSYATWTSPIRKYSDMVNHRLIKAVIAKQEADFDISEELLINLAEKRKQHRMCEREVGDWLYARFFKSKASLEQVFDAEVIDINRGGVRVRLVENGAIAFLPASTLVEDKTRLDCSGDSGMARVDSEPKLRLADRLKVQLTEVKIEQRSLVAKPVTLLDA